MAIKVETRREINGPVVETERYATWSDVVHELTNTATPEYQERVFGWWEGSIESRDTPLVIDNGPTVDTWTVD